MHSLEDSEPIRPGNRSNTTTLAQGVMQAPANACDAEKSGVCENCYDYNLISSGCFAGRNNRPLELLWDV